MDEKHIFESWKEIADYLGRSIRTCERWERQFGLPVHRLGHSPKASIFANKEEIDRWQEHKLHHISRVLEKERLRRLLVKMAFILVITVTAVSIIFFVLKPGLRRQTDLPRVPAAATTTPQSNVPDKTGSPTVIRRVSPVSSRSWEAYKNLMEGMSFFDGGDYRQAISFFQKALSLDPQFAMAYLGMGWCLNFLGCKTESAQCFQNAFDLRKELTERERLRVEGHFYAQAERTYPNAFAALKELLARYPDEISANLTLERLHFRIEEFDQAEELCLAGLQTGILNSRTYLNLAWCYQTKGLYQEAEKLFQAYFAQDPSNMLMRQGYARHLLAQGRLEPALDEINKAIVLNPRVLENYMIRGDIYLYRNDFAAARKEYKRLSRLGEPSGILWQELRLAAVSLGEGKIKELGDHIAEGVKYARNLSETLWEMDFLLFLADVNTRLGSPDEAWKTYNRFWMDVLSEGKLDVQRRILHQEGILHLRRGNLRNAEAAAFELGELIHEGMNKRAMRYHYHLLGLKAIEEGKTDEAVESLEKAAGLLFSAHFGSDSDDAAPLRTSLAFAYFKKGLLDRAAKEYEEVGRMTVSRILYGDLYAKSFYMLGRIAEQTGDKEKARARYREFLDLWKGADSGISEVEDAVQRLRDSATLSLSLD